ncbi:N-acyl amino acid synthase FeeM domain-containing protein [Oricola thermophila]|uniref:Acetyltransferase n=1 Tax=Oricola thermophila TaxID=2742145 RepID=A0A6N1VHW4_9HYPH|nr:acetyltransferase [Oricola thermophila]QKV20344.1 acetyltransferase [Oricola thermophila]
MDRIEYRRIVSPEDFEDISQLRSLAFDAHAIYSRKLNGNATDDSDFWPGVQVFGMYYDRELVSTIRIAHVTPKNRDCQAVRLFPEVLDPLLDQGQTFIDPSRFAVNDEISRDVPGLALLTLRLAFMATKYFGVDACLGLVTEDHVPFYRRVFRSTVIAGPKKCEGFAVPLVLFASPLREEEICARYPLFRSTAKEREMLFDTPASGMPPLTILPTAKYVAHAA